MPCNSDYMLPTASEQAAVNEFNQKLKAFLDNLTHDLDRIREWILEGMPKNHALVAKATMDRRGYALDLVREHSRLYMPNPLPKELMRLADEHEEYRQKIASGKSFATARIERRQIKHRKQDLDRLLKTFADGGINKKVLIEKVLAADPAYPLESQLGFDPDFF